jgi:hypothetical protein
MHAYTLFKSLCSPGIAIGGPGIGLSIGID